MKQQFQAQITGRGPNSAWIQMDIPFDVQKAFGSKGVVPVTGAINRVTYRNSLKPNGDGTHYMHINKELLAEIGVKVGDTVKVTMEKDLAPRTVEIPADLQSALKPEPGLAKAFAGLSYSHQKEFVDWIVQAKKPETRSRRVAKALEMVAAKQNPKG
jgi:hypothetical protein